MKQQLSLTFFIICLFSFSAIFCVEDEARTEIINLLQKWPRDFNAKNSEAACALFAPDLIATYSGAPDRNYQEMCRSLKAVLTDPNKTFTYDAPVIEQIMIQGDMAVVRLIWNLQISNKNQLTTESVKERGLDVFKRQKDGSWKIAISYAYTESD